MENNNNEEPKPAAPAYGWQGVFTKRAVQAVVFALLLTLAVFTVVAFTLVNKSTMLSKRAEQIMEREVSARRLENEAEIINLRAVAREKEATEKLAAATKLEEEWVSIRKKTSLTLQSVQSYETSQKAWEAEAANAAKTLKSMAAVPIATTTVVSGDVDVTVHQAGAEKSLWERTKAWVGGATPKK